MSIFGGSERFPDEPARSPGPIYGRTDPRSKSHAVMKPDYKPVDETRKWGKRESWIAGSYSAHMPIVPKESNRAPGQYHVSVDPIKTQAPKVSFPKSSRFLSQRVNVTDKNHQHELMTEESPGPKYNVHSLASNGGKNEAPKFSFAPPSPETKTRLPNVDSPRKGHRESWMSVINRNGVLIMPASPAPPRTGAAQDTARAASEAARAEEVVGTSNNSPRSRSAMCGSVFGNEHRFGVRQQQQQQQQDRVETPRKSVASTRVQFVSTKHTRENMGEFSPGPIYNPYNPECPGGRLAPSPKSGRREAPPSSPHDPKNPDANMSSRSSWLAGNVRKSEGMETVLMRTGDIPPGPGTYSDPRSSFATFSHNTKVMQPSKASRPSPSPTKYTDRSSVKSASREDSVRTPEATK